MSTQAETGAPAFRLGYRPELDGVRGIAILLVLLHHAGTAPVGGFLGVDLFFVLSGFLITLLLAQEWEETGTISLKAFYMRRVLRLVPALLAFILVLLVLGWCGGPACLRLGNELWFTLGYCLNWAIAYGWTSYRSPLVIAWSLSIEEQFYILWPPLFRSALRRARARSSIVAVLVLLVLGVACWREWTLVDWLKGFPANLYLQGLTPQDVFPRSLFFKLYYSSHTRADGLLLGCIFGLLVAWRLVDDRLRWLFRAVGFAVLLGLVACLMQVNARDLRLFTVNLTLINLGFALCVFNLVRWPGDWSLSLLRLAPMVWLGKISYALYLWHYAFYVWVENERIQGWTGPVVIVVGSILTATLSYFIVERPALKLKKRWKTFA
ncbi:acyltransferase [bacterium CPR1]|nr:acyltransferase [bacterium CPR1]